MVEIKTKSVLAAAFGDEIKQWEWAKKELDRAKAREAELREAVVAQHFHNAPIGTNHHDCDDGFDLVCVKKLNYKLDKDTTANAQEKLIPLIGIELAARLVNWKPDLSLTEYKKLPDAARAIIDEVLTISPATPTLELKGPK